jgi:hypothetical protein
MGWNIKEVEPLRGHNAVTDRYLELIKMNRVKCAEGIK